MKKMLCGLGIGTVLGFVAAIVAGFIVCEVTETIAVPEPAEEEATMEDFA